LKKSVARLLRLFRGLRSLPGGRRTLPSRLARRPCALATLYVTVRSTFRTRPLACPAEVSRAAAVGRYPFCASVRRLSLRGRLRFGVVARDRPATPNQSTGPGTTSGPDTTGPIRLARRAAAERRRSTVRRNRTPLLRFSSPSVLAGRAALSGAAGLRTIPLRRLISPARAACGPAGKTSPMRFFALADTLR